MPIARSLLAAAVTALSLAAAMPAEAEAPAAE